MALTDWQTEQPPLAVSAVAPTRAGSPAGTPTGSQASGNSARPAGTREVPVQRLNGHDLTHA